MKILLHTCCGPCTKGTLKELDRTKHEITAYWYNPNIHPYQEYKSRKESLKTLAASIGMDVIEEDEYGLRKFVKAVVNDIDNRCKECYMMRLVQTAKKAKELGFDAFSTTLLVSPYQQHEVIKEMATKIGEQMGIPFHYVDPRSHFREGNREARDMGLYMQKYCGCIFSEEDRYLKTNKKAKKS